MAEEEAPTIKSNKPCPREGISTEGIRRLGTGWTSTPASRLDELSKAGGAGSRQSQSICAPRPVSASLRKVSASRRAKLYVLILLLLLVGSAFLGFALMR
jgi:hypothetical protein